MTRLQVVLRQMVNGDRRKFLMHHGLGLAITHPTPPADTYKLTLSRIGPFTERGRKLIYPTAKPIEMVTEALLELLPVEEMPTVKTGERYTQKVQKDGETLVFGCVSVFWRSVPVPPEVKQTAIFETSPVGNNYKE